MALEIHIEEEFNMYTKKVWVMERRGNDMIYYNIGKDGNMVETIRKNDEPYVLNDDKYKPFMIIPMQMAQSFLLELTKVLSGMGIRTENEHKTEGKLEAVEKHLEDMQKIVFKQLKIDNPPKETGT